VNAAKQAMSFLDLASRRTAQMKTAMLQPVGNLNLYADFSFISGGPLFRFRRRLQPSGDKLTSLRLAIIVIPLLAWLPLLLLSAAGGKLFSGSVAVPFQTDFEVHTRFLLALPLLLLAEFVVERRIRHLPQEFLERNLVPENAMAQFDAAIKSTSRWCTSTLAEVLLIALVYGVGVLLIWRQYVALDIAAWYVTPSARGSKLTLAGIWYGYVSLPIFQFLLCRWYYRLFIWARFLWQVSRIKLKFVPTHPDRVGGLSFLSHKSNAFAVLAVAHGTLLAGNLTTRVVSLGMPLIQFKAEIAVMVVFVLCIILGPLLVFTPQLIWAKRKGRREYGVLAESYVREFDRKWLRGGAPPQEPLIGNSDIQSLADLANSYSVVRTMRAVLITKETVLGLAVATLAPLAPLLLTMMSLEELVKQLVGILLK
jgi:hypothetical protein